MKRCGKLRCEICKYVDEGCTLKGDKGTYFINFHLTVIRRGLFVIESVRDVKRFMRVVQ